MVLAQFIAALQAAEESTATLAPVDLVGLGIVGLFLLLGFFRGLWWQVMRLVALVAAVVLARIFDGPVYQKLLAQWPDLDPRIGQGVAWGAIFLAVLAAGMILAFLGRRALQALQLGLSDRVGGALLGAVTGLLIHLMLMVGFVHLAPEELVKQAVAGTWSGQAVELVIQRWPLIVSGQAAEEIERLLQGGG